MRTVVVLAVVLLTSGSQGVLAQFALGHVTEPESVHDNPANDYWPQFATDGAGNWVVVWESPDILAAHSSDGGVTWSDPDRLSGSPTVLHPRIATDGQGTWIAIWVDDTDGTVRISRGTGGQGLPPTWSHPEVSNLGGPAWTYGNPTLAHDGAGTWVLLWYSGPESWIIRSVDDGVTWSAPELFPIREPEVSSNGSGTLIAIGPSGTSTIVVSRSTDGGVTWSAPTSMTTGKPVNPAASDGAGNWVLVAPYYYLPGSDGSPFHVRYARSEDDGLTWSAGWVALSQWVLESAHPDVATDDEGNWLVVWESKDNLDHEIWLGRSTDRTLLWSEEEQLTDASGYDGAPRIARDVGGHWVVVWHGRGIGFDTDILTARITLFCDEFVEDRSYGALLFEPTCARQWENRAQDLYDATERGIHRGAEDVFYLSSEGDGFAALVAGDIAEINGVDSGLGPYAYTSFPPSFDYYAPIETTLVPQAAHEVTGLIPLGQGTVSFDLLTTAADSIYGNTAVYLVRDCGLFVTGEADEIRFVTHDDSTTGTPPEFDMRYGLLSDLRADGNFSQAACLGHFLDNPATLDLSDPPAGDGFYYLARGLSSCAAQGYGSSGLDPDPRDLLDTLPRLSLVATTASVGLSLQIWNESPTLDRLFCVSPAAGRGRVRKRVEENSCTTIS